MAKRIAVIFLSICLLFVSLPFSVSAEPFSPRIIFDGEEITFQNSLDIRDGHTLAPLRELAEKVGFTVTWDDPTIILKDQASFEIIFTVKDSKVFVNGKEKFCPRAPEILDNITYVPLRFLCENMGFRVVYADHTITITQDVDSMILTPKLKQTKTYLPLVLSKLMSVDQNYVISPWGVKMLLAMTANGAKGDTLQEMLDTLQASDLNALNDYMGERVASYGDRPQIMLKTANSLWLNSGYDTYDRFRFSDHYFDALRTRYQADAFLVEPDEAVAQINDWTSRSTNGYTREFLGDADFLTAFINTFTFEAKWKYPFKEEDTIRASFTDRAERVSEIEYMQMQAKLRYYEDRSMQLIEFPYVDEGFGMYVLLPKTGQIGYSLDAAIERMQEETMLVSIPKFHASLDMDISSVVKYLGVNQGFNENADFSAMFEKSLASLKLGKVLQKAAISVDEQGTTIQSATYLQQKSVPEPSSLTIFEANHPFLFMIRDNQSGEILFIGEYAFAE